MFDPQPEKWVKFHPFGMKVGQTGLVKSTIKKKLGFYIPLPDSRKIGPSYLSFFLKQTEGFSSEDNRILA